MKFSVFVAILFIGIHPVLCQEKKMPVDINEAITILSSDMPHSLQEKIKTTTDDKLLNLIERHGGSYNTIFTWSLQDKILVKYYTDMGVSYHDHIQHIILLAFKRYLNHETFDHEQLITPFKKREIKWLSEDSSRSTLDTLRGNYIPSDLQDCFKQINGFWSDSFKNVIKHISQNRFTADAHFSFGMWMRNNWQLWGGSRLSKYFNDMGIYHPDDMSGIILVSYYRYLNNKPIELEKQVQSHKGYWLIAKMPPKEKYPGGTEDLSFSTTQFYKSKKIKRGAVHFAEDDAHHVVWLFDYHLGWARVTPKQSEELQKKKSFHYERFLKKLFRKNRIVIRH